MDNYSSSRLGGVNNEEAVAIARQQIAIANAVQFIEKVTEKCFAKCISKPGSSLDNSEQKCIAMCMDRYQDSFNLVSTAYLSRLRDQDS